MKLLEGGANARTLNLVNKTRIQTLPTRQNMANRGPGGAPMKPSNGRQAPKNMTQGQTRKAMRGLFNAANAFGN